jgi:hypothetical protein
MICLAYVAFLPISYGQALFENSVFMDWFWLRLDKKYNWWHKCYGLNYEFWKENDEFVK